MGFNFKKKSVRILIISLVFIGILQIVHSQNVIYKSLNPITLDKVGEAIVIEDNRTPIASITGTWSVCNFSITIGVILMTVIVNLAKTRYYNKTNIYSAYTRRKLPKYQSLALMIVVVLLLVLTESFNGYSVIINKWTALYIFIAFIQIYVCTSGLERLRPAHKPDEN